MTRAILALVLLLASCATAPLPSYPIVGCALRQAPPPVPSLVIRRDCGQYDWCLDKQDEAALLAWVGDVKLWDETTWDACRVPLDH